MVRALRPLGSFFLVLSLILLVASVPPAAGTHVPAFEWDWCVEGKCLPDDGPMGIYADTDPDSGSAYYHVGFSGRLGSVSCSGHRSSWTDPLTVSGSIVFPREIAGEVVKTTIPCDDLYAYVGPVVIDDLITLPDDFCEHWGQVRGVSETLGTIRGSGGYLTYCA